MKKLNYVLLTAISTLLTMFAVPALADKPVPFPTEPNTFNAVDPCTGAEQEITINFDVMLHIHKNMYVGTVTRTGESDAGYELISGTAIRLETFKGGLFFDQYVDIWRSEDGRMFQASFQILLDTTTEPWDLKAVHGNYRCIGGETIL